MSLTGGPSTKACTWAIARVKGLETVGEMATATFVYFDNSVDNVVSKTWSEIDVDTQNLIKGGTKLATIVVPATASIYLAETGIKSAQIATAGGRAASIANALRLKTELSLKQGNILNNDGRLTVEAIDSADIIRLKDGLIKNPSIVQELTKDGSKITDWEKFTTQSVSGPNGSSLQVHFYKNKVTGKIDYETPDFKVKGVVPSN